MKYLKYALIFFFVVDVSIFLVSQVAPDMLVRLLPQFNIESAGSTYPRLVGVLFLALGLARLYGAVYIEEKGAFALSMWSWVIELVHVTTEVFHGQFAIGENLAALVVAPIMLLWSIYYYKSAFRQRI